MTEDVTVQMDVSKILASILVHLKEVSVPTELFMSLDHVDRQIEINYDDDNKLFIFKLGGKVGSESNNN